MKHISEYLHPTVAKIIKKELERVKAETMTNEERSSQLASACKGKLCAAIRYRKI
tara:strand:+ start:1935 stop:2099 length:165 start_codon:yes stop_codon:yes gene_type:complete